MQYQEQTLGELYRIFLTDTLISISGESGAGKTTLAQLLMGNLLVRQPPYFGSCIWVQASEKFPHRRLSQLFHTSAERLEYLKQNIFITPQSSFINSYEDFLDSIHHLTEKNSILPPDLRYIVVDNISHHLRYEISQIADVKKIVDIQDNFYDDMLLPLIMFCQRNNTHLILIHENTFVPRLNTSKPFFYKLYERVRHIHFVLSKSYNSTVRNLIIQHDTSKKTYKYLIQKQGIVFVK
ncbi:MAG: AAA family ATPase [Promethearchaeota archaeon]|jgi:ABC-type oligopeptide transport system ATPase subunit